MTDDLEDVKAFANTLRKLRGRRRRKIIRKRPKRLPRASLTPKQREAVLQKTNGHCHICGGSVEGEKWQADHVLAHAIGGSHSIANYLAAHSVCNSYRRSFSDAEFQWVIKLGVWLRMQIEKKSSIGLEAGQKFVSHHERLAS